jgi:hypothetical protein
MLMFLLSWGLKVKNKCDMLCLLVVDQKPANRPLL